MIVPDWFAPAPVYVIGVNHACFGPNFDRRPGYQGIVGEGEDILITGVIIAQGPALHGDKKFSLVANGNVFIEWVGFRSKFDIDDEDTRYKCSGWGWCAGLRRCRQGSGDGRGSRGSSCDGDCSSWSLSRGLRRRWGERWGRGFGYRLVWDQREINDRLKGCPGDGD